MVELTRITMLPTSLTQFFDEHILDVALKLYLPVASTPSENPEQLACCGNKHKMNFQIENH